MSFTSVGLSALRNAQIGLTVAGQNIANASTPGFHRQGIVQSSTTPLSTGVGFIGQGAQITTIRRAINQTLETQLLQVQAQGAQLDSYLAQLTPLDNALGLADTGLSASFNEFFRAVSAVSANPSSTPARQVLISDGQALASQFQSIGNQFDSVRDGLDTQIRDSVSSINSFATQIANLNRQIALQTGTAPPGQVPNDLLDQREELISQLNKEVGTTTIIQTDGSASVFFGSGQPLVIEDQVFTLTASPGRDDSQHLQVAYTTGTATTLIGSNNISGGRLGGLLSFRDQVLDTAQNTLGRIAVGLAQSFNDQHRLGQDLAGNAGLDFFNIPSATVLPSTSNTGNGVISTSLTNAQDLTTSDYRLVATAVGFTIVRLSDNTQTNITAAQLSAGFTIDGTTIQLTAGVTAIGDRYLIQPTRNIASNIGLSANINTTTVAAAAPIRTSATLGNLGTGQISAGSVNSPNDTLTVTFTTAGTYNVVDTTTGAALATNVAYASPATLNFNGVTATISGAGATGDVFTITNGVTNKSASGTGSTTVISDAAISVTPLNPNLRNTVTFTYNSTTNRFDVFDVTASLALPSVPTAGTYNPATGLSVSVNGVSVTLTGTPQNGDVFTISPNTNGIADNRNALLLAQLQSRTTLAGGTESYEGSFAELASFVGSRTNEIQVTSEAQNTLIQQTQAAQQSVSGVNLDEEAADLLRFQQAYQAAARSLQISATLFDTLLSIGQ